MANNYLFAYHGRLKFGTLHITRRNPFKPKGKTNGKRST